MSDTTVPVRGASIPVRGVRAVVVEGPDAGLSKEAEQDTISVGTASDNDLVLTDGTVSRYHLELRGRGDGIEVLAPALVASELFGHERGAFTGADQQRLGAFERADGGTLFLDEIGELPPALQAALLGALERRSFKRVGGDRPINVDVRVVCATNRDLRSEVNANTFRQDLYYRIAVVTLRIPPLRERKDDIPVLIEHFLREARHYGSVEEVIPPNVMASLFQHRWPGNVRELRNFVDAAIAIGSAPPLEASAEAREPEPSRQSDPDADRSAGPPFPKTPLKDVLGMSFKDARDRVLAEFEEVYLRELLVRSGDNVSRAARISEIHRSYLNLLLKRYGFR